MTSSGAIVRKKVAVISSVHDARDPRVSLKVTRSLSRKYDTHLIAGFNDEHGDEILFKEKFISEAHWHPLPRMRNNGDRLRRQRLIYQHLRKLKPDVIYIHDPELYPLGLALRWLQGSKIIMDFHEDTFDRSFKKNDILKHLTRHAFRNADGIITAFELNLRPYHPVPDVPHCELLNYFPDSLSVEIDAVTIQPLPEHCLLYTGTIHSNRGLHHILNCTEYIAGQGLDFHSIIAGRCFIPAELKRLRSEITRRGLQERVHILGGNKFMDWFTLQKLQREASLGSLLVSPDALNWQFPTKCYEYLANKLPWLMTPVPSFQQFSQQFGGGLEVQLNSGYLSESDLDQVITWLKHPQALFKPNVEQPSWESQESALFGLIEN